MVLEMFVCGVSLHEYTICICSVLPLLGANGNSYSAVKRQVMIFHLVIQSRLVICLIEIFEAPGGCRSGARVATVVTRSTLIKGSEVQLVIS